MILEGTLLQSADPAKGRFRSLLIKSLKNFLIDAAVKRQTQKRGGDLQFVSWEKWMAEAPSQLSISAEALEPCSSRGLVRFELGGGDCGRGPAAVANGVRK